MSIQFPATTFLQFLLLVGLVLDLIGAILLVGPGFKLADKLGVWLWADLKDASEAWVRLNRDWSIDGDQVGFFPLARVIRKHQTSVWADSEIPFGPGEWNPSKMGISSFNDQLRVVVHHDSGQYNLGHELVRDILRQTIESRFHRYGVGLLAVGFTFQILSVVLELVSLT